MTVRVTRTHSIRFQSGTEDLCRPAQAIKTHMQINHSCQEARGESWGEGDSRVRLYLHGSYCVR